MAFLVKNVSFYKMSDILDNPIDEECVYLIDMVVDEKRLDRGKFLKNQPEAGFIFRVSLNPNIQKVIQKKILGYKLSVESRLPEPETPSAQATPQPEKLSLPAMEISFYDDFGSVDTGEKNFKSIISSVMSYEPFLIAQKNLSSEGKKIAAPLDTLGGKELEKAFKNLTDKQDMSEFFNSTMACINAGESPDDLAELSLPSFSIEPFQVIYQPPQKNKNFLLPRPGDVFSLREDREHKIKSLFPPAESDLAVVHEFTAIEGTNSSVVSESSVVYGSNPYFQSVRDIEVPAYMMRPDRDLYFIFTPIVHDANGDAFEDPEHYIEKNANQTILKINHYNAVNNLTEPEVSPTSRIILDKPGTISYIVNKNDAATDQVTVILKYVNQATGEVVQGGYATHRFNNISHSTEMGSFAGCLNRAPYIPILTTATMSSGVTLSTQVIGKLHPTSHSTSFLSGIGNMIALNTPDGISVRFFTTSERVQRLTIYREDMKLSDQSDNKIKALVTTNRPTPAFEFLDSTAVGGRTYRYFTKAQIKDATSPFNGRSRALYEVILPDDDIIQRKVDTDGSVLYDASVIRINNKTGTVLKPKATVTDSGFSFFVKDVISAGFNDEFSDIIKSNRSKLEDIAYFTVERIDKVTGDRKTFPVLRNEESFVDSSASEFRSYIYVFRLALINMEAVLIASSLLGSDINKIESDKNSQNAIKSLFKSFTKSTGVIPSPAEILSLTAGEIVNASLTGLEVYSEVAGSLTKIAPTITKSQEGHWLTTSLSTPFPKSYKITWKSNGAVLSEVDSFYVYCRFEGATTVIKTIAVTPGVTTYTAIDSVYYNAVGEKEYYVKAKYNDNKLGPKSNSVFITKESSISTSHIGRTTVIDHVDIITDSSKYPMSKVIDIDV